MMGPPQSSRAVRPRLLFGLGRPRIERIDLILHLLPANSRLLLLVLILQLLSATS